MALGTLLVLALVGTAIYGQRGAIEREALVRAQVWCEALVDSDVLRYKDTFRRDYFPSRLDRAANIYREPTEASIRAQMPATKECRVDGPLRISTAKDEVFVRVTRDGEELDLRMRKESGFWVVGQLVKPE